MIAQDGGKLAGIATKGSKPVAKLNFTKKAIEQLAQGKPERIKIGAFPDISIEGARAQASGMNAVIAQGGNPAEDRRAVRAEMTLQELFDTFLSRHAKQRKRTWQEDVRTFNRYLH